MLVVPHTGILGMCVAVTADSPEERRGGDIGLCHGHARPGLATRGGGHRAILRAVRIGLWPIDRVAHTENARQHAVIPDGVRAPACGIGKR